MTRRNMKYLKLFEDQNIEIEKDRLKSDVKDILQCLEDEGFTTQVDIYQPPASNFIYRLYLAIMKDKFTYADIKDVIDHIVSYLDEENLVIYKVLISDESDEDSDFLSGSGHPRYSYSNTSFGEYLITQKSIWSNYGEVSVPNLSHFEENPNLTIIKYIKLTFLVTSSSLQDNTQRKLRFKLFFESSYVNPMKDLIYDFTDMGFEVTQEIGHLYLYYESDKPDKVNTDQMEIFRRYTEMLDRAKDELTITDHRIEMRPFDIYIEIAYDMKSLDQISMTGAQKTAFDAMIKCIKNAYGEGYELKPNSIVPSGSSDRHHPCIKFDLDGESARPGYNTQTRWISIYSDGLVKYPRIQGNTRNDANEGSFTDADVKWFSRLLEIGKDELGEYNKLLRMEQGALRRLYP